MARNFADFIVANQALQNFEKLIHYSFGPSLYATVLILTLHIIHYRQALFDDKIMSDLHLLNVKANAG